MLFAEFCLLSFCAVFCFVRVWAAKAVGPRTYQMTYLARIWEALKCIDFSARTWLSQPPKIFSKIRRLTLLMSLSAMCPEKFSCCNIHPTTRTIIHQEKKARTSTVQTTVHTLKTMHLSLLSTLTWTLQLQAYITRSGNYTACVHTQFNSEKQHSNTTFRRPSQIIMYSH